MMSRSTASSPAIYKKFSVRIEFKDGCANYQVKVDGMGEELGTCGGEVKYVYRVLVGNVRIT